MTRLRIGVLLTGLLCGVALAGRASAHHSIQAQFDIHKTVTVSGTVAKVEFINPHSYLTVNVKDADGKVTRWAFEMAAAGQLRRAGLSRADRGGLKPDNGVNRGRGHSDYLPSERTARRDNREGNTRLEQLRDEGGDAVSQRGTHHSCHADGVFELRRPCRSSDGYQVTGSHHPKARRPHAP